VCVCNSFFCSNTCQILVTLDLHSNTVALILTIQDSISASVQGVENKILSIVGKEFAATGGTYLLCIYIVMELFSLSCFVFCFTM